MSFINDRFIPFIGWLIINFIGKTSSVKIINHKKVTELKENKINFIYAFWHSRLFYLVYSHRKQNICAMTSQSKDGEYLSKVINKCGFTTVRGSSSRGGRKAFAQMLKKLKDNVIVAIAPDGPRGPAKKAQAGAIYLAQKSGCPIVPLTYSAKRTRNLSSWDKFLVPFPFNRFFVITGEPIYVGHEDNLEQKNQEVEKAINKITDDADRLVGNKNVLSL